MKRGDDSLALAGIKSSHDQAHQEGMPLQPGWQARQVADHQKVLVIKTDERQPTLRRRSGLTDLRIHDLRRTMGAWLVRTGANTAINAKALGHKSMQAAAVYQRIADTDPVREAMGKATTAFMGGGK